MKLGGLREAADGIAFRHEAELGDELRCGALRFNLPVLQPDDVVGKLYDAFLMRDDHDRAAVARLVDIAERFGQAVEAPQVDARFGLVVDRKLRVAGEDRGDLDALDLAAREVLVDFAGEVVSRAEADFGQVLVAGPPLGPVMTVNLSSSMVSDKLSMMRLFSLDPSETGTSNTRSLISNMLFSVSRTI